MCGVIGQWNSSRINLDKLTVQAKKISHRGPDNFGIWSNKEENIALAHLRLSILDLTDSGNQPMISFSSRYVISFNGEIYNFLSLKDEIKKRNPSIVFDGESDTEVLLALIELYGFQETIKKCIGMFAIALWDNKEKLLYLARDAAGEKPLYYYQDSENLIFASELKGVLFDDLQFNISQKSINLFLSQGNVPAPFTIYENIFKVRPGEILVFTSPSHSKSINFWTIDNIEIDNQLTQHKVNQKFESLFLESVESQMISDVPIGGFLSGGIDSTAVISAMSEISSQKVNTYSMGFNEKDFNEANKAQTISNHLGTNHHEFLVNEDDALRVIPNLQNVYCEPFADSSQIPTYLLCKETSKDLTVCLSGDGGDEIFGGYRRYIDIQRFQDLIIATPYSLRLVIVKFLKIYQNIKFKKPFDPLLRYLLNLSHPSEQLYKISNVLEKNNLRDIYYSLALQWHHGIEILQNKNYADPSIELDEIFNLKLNDVHDIRKLDIKNYLPNDILVKVDRAAMSNSLETRVPFLDKRLVEFGLSIPMNFLIHNHQGKVPVREFLKKRVPDKLIDGPKTGFGVPIKYWLKGRLRPWAEDLINDHILIEELGLDCKKIEYAWKNFQYKNLPLHHGFWNILMLQSWYKTWN